MLSSPNSTISTAWRRAPPPAMRFSPPLRDGRSDFGPVRVAIFEHRLRHPHRGDREAVGDAVRRLPAPADFRAARHDANALRGPGPGRNRSRCGLHAFRDGDQEHEEHLDYSWLSGAGAIASTAGDLERWNEAIDRGALLSPESRTMMHTPMHLADGTDTHYGFGLFLQSLPGIGTSCCTAATRPASAPKTRVSSRSGSISSCSPTKSRQPTMRS